MRPEDRDEFLAAQRERFRRADAAHFEWQARGAGLAQREREFLRETMGGTRTPLLEIGSGEGSNLFHLLKDPARLGLHVGLDAFLPKLAFAAKNVSGGNYVAADAGHQPFAKDSFPTVLIRDVLHHLADPRSTVEEAVRVLAPGGTFVVIEPNRQSPLIKLQMALVATERGAARSDETWLRNTVRDLPLDGVSVTPAAPFPLERVVLHPDFGLPRLGRSPRLLRALGGIETLAGRLIGRNRWSYWVLRGTKRLN